MGRRNVWLKFCAPGWGMVHWSGSWRKRKASRQWPQTHIHMHTELQGSWETVRVCIHPMDSPVSRGVQHQIAVKKHHPRA